MNDRDKKKTRFYYQIGRRQLFENRLINIRIFDKNLSHSISFDDHSNSHNFHDPDDTIKNFLNLFLVRYEPRGKVQMECAFSIINYQPPPEDGFTEVTDTRIWSTYICTCVLFNDFVKENITEI